MLFNNALGFLCIEVPDITEDYRLGDSGDFARDNESEGEIWRAEISVIAMVFEY